MLVGVGGSRQQACPAVGIKNIHRITMLDVRRLIHFGARAVGCPVLLGKTFDVRYCTRQSYCMFRIKLRDVPMQRLRRVAPGIKGDKENAGALCVIAKQPHYVRQSCHGNGAFGIAMGEPEIHQYLIAFVCFRCYRTAAIGSQGKIQIRQMSGYLFHMPGFFGRATACREHYRQAKNMREKAPETTDPFTSNFQYAFNIAANTPEGESFVNL